MPSTALYSAPSTPQQAQMLEKAKAYHQISEPGMPSDWAFNSAGQLVHRETGGPVGSAAPNSAPGSGFWGQLGHASPYIGAAFGMGALGGLVGTGGAAAAETAAAAAPAAAGGFPAAALVGGASAIPASAGGALVPTIAPGLATSLSAGSMIPTATSVAGAAGTASKLAGYLKTAKTIGGMASDWSQARSAMRNDASAAAYRNNRSASERFTTQLLAERDKLAAPQARADNSLRGDRLANAQDLHIQLPSNIPEATVTGGFRPSMWSDNTRQLGREMSAQALDSQQHGGGVYDAPPLENVPQPNALDSILNTASLVSAVPYSRQKRVPQPGDPDYVG